MPLQFSSGGRALESGIRGFTCKRLSTSCQVYPTATNSRRQSTVPAGNILLAAWQGMPYEAISMRVAAHLIRYLLILFR
jgi:hypothetical protein